MNRSNYEIGDLLVIRAGQDTGWIGRVLQVRRCAVLHRTEYLIKARNGSDVWVNHLEVYEHTLEENHES